jgi:hypothetical protein
MEVRGDPNIRIYSMGNVTRGETGQFEITTDGLPLNGYVYFSVSGTAIRGVDYVALVSPTYINTHCSGHTCWGLIPVTTLPDPRGSIFPQAYSVVITLTPGIGYVIGEPSSAKMMIEP